MNKNKTSILEMNYNEARNFLLKSNNYFDLNLPKYFDLDYLIESATKILSTSDIDKKTHILKGKRSQTSNVNYIIQTNKTNSSYRPITLIHPYLYVDMINCLTSEDNWSTFTNRFKYLNNISIDNIICSSIPFSIRNQKNKDIKPDSKDFALNFWENIEQETIKNSLKYKQLLKLDISNFYSSIYTHTIPWGHTW